MKPLEYLNALRVAQGLSPLKAWKGSKAKLEAKIADLEGNLTPQMIAKIKGPEEAHRQSMHNAAGEFEATDDELSAQTTRPKDPDAPASIDPNGTLDKLARRDEVTVPDIKHTRSASASEPNVQQIKRASKKSGPQGKPRDPTNGGRIKAPGSKSVKRGAKEPMNGAFGQYLKDNNLQARSARAKLRRMGMKGPYRLTEEIKKILVSDRRKHKK